MSSVHNPSPLVTFVTDSSRKTLILVFIGCWLGGIFDGMDSMLMHMVLPVALKDLTGRADPVAFSQIASVISAVFLLGWTVGGFCFGYLGDRFGRVKAMMGSILVYSLFTGLCGLAQSWEQLAVFRGLTGLGIGGEMVSMATLLAEVWPERSRALAIGMLFTSYQAGIMLAGGLHKLVPDWRMVFLLGALPALLLVVLRTFMGESQRWLHDQAQQKAESATNAAASGSLALLLGRTGYRKEVIIATVAFGGGLLGFWASLAWTASWVATLPGMPEDARSLITLLQGLGAIVGTLVAGLLCNGLGRRWAITIGAVGCFAMATVMFLSNPVFSVAIYWQSLLAGGFSGLHQASMFVFIPELFPTRIRATGTGISVNVSRLATVAAVLGFGALVPMLGGYGQAAVLFAPLYLLSVVAMLFARETKDQLLPE